MNVKHKLTVLFKPWTIAAFMEGILHHLDFFLIWDAAAQRSIMERFDSDSVSIFKTQHLQEEEYCDQSHHQYWDN